MSDTATVQLRRLLRVIPGIADGEEHALAAVARLAEVEPSSVLDDLRAIALRLDDPAGHVEGVQICIEAGRVSVVTPHFRRPMRLTMAELCALELGLAMLAAERPPDERPAIERARARLRSAIAALPADAVPEGLRAADAGAAGVAETLALVRSAIRAKRELRIGYRKSGSADRTTRVVRPYGVLSANGAWYLVAHDTGRDAVRVFRLDRVEGAELLDGRFAVEDGFSLTSVLKDGRVFGGAPDGAVLRVRYSARIARWIAERTGRATEGDGTLVMEHPLADVEWGVRHALQYGADAEVLAPEGVRGEVVRRLTEMRPSVAAGGPHASS